MNKYIQPSRLSKIELRNRLRKLGYNNLTNNNISKQSLISNYQEALISEKNINLLCEEIANDLLLSEKSQKRLQETHHYQNPNTFILPQQLNDKTTKSDLNLTSNSISPFSTKKQTSKTKCKQIVINLASHAILSFFIKKIFDTERITKISHIITVLLQKAKLFIIKSFSNINFHNLLTTINNYIQNQMNTNSLIIIILLSLCIILTLFLLIKHIYTITHSLNNNNTN